MKRKLNTKKDILKEIDEGYPVYPPDEDIYGKYEKARNINPEDPTKTKPVSERRKMANNNSDFSDDLTGEDLDVPGSELDDDLEMIGDEDEENNYYSLGGDRHNDLDEDYGE